MKKIIFLFLLLPLIPKAQILDTVIVRNLQMQAQDWAWLVGKIGMESDSVSILTVRKIRLKVQQAIPPTWTTNLTVDSLPGRVVIGFYETVMRSDAGEIVNRFTAIKNAISAKTNLSFWIGFIDGRISAEFDRKRDIGKNILIDQ